MDTTCLPISSSDSTNEDGIDDAIEGFGKLDIGAGGPTCDSEPEAEDDVEDDVEDDAEDDAEDDVEDDAEDEAEDDSDNDTGPPFTRFEANHPWLFKNCKRSCPFFTGPEVAMDRLNTVKPAKFYRICDEQTFIKFSSEKGFVNEACAGVPSWPFIDADGVINHFNWEKADNPFITRFISMCSTTYERDNEIAWRRRIGRSITVFEISGQGLAWGRIRQPPFTCIDCLFCRGTAATHDDIVFNSAAHLFEGLEIEKERVSKEKAWKGAQDEWLAVQCIPPDMITDYWHLS